jgi:hypothetical protein
MEYGDVRSDWEKATLKKSIIPKNGRYFLAQVVDKNFM